MRYPQPLAMLALVTTLGTSAGAAQQPDYAQHFRVFTGKGEPAQLADVIAAMKGADAVLVGESHSDPVGHYLEAELFRGALEYARTGGPGGGARPLALSLEMFERDVQGVLDEYLQGLITEEQFRAAARPWDYYATDYRPMVELAKSAGVPVIAANAPRRYVNRVSRLGRDALAALPASARQYLPPLPYPQPSEAYRREWLALMSDMPMQPQCPVAAAPAPHPPARDSAAAVAHAPARDSAAAPRPAMPTHAGAFMENGLQAQALWDASMASAITAFLAAHPGALVLHAVGGFHVENFTGIPEQVQHYRPGTRTLVVSMEPAADFRTFDRQEHGGQGDFVILTDRALDLEQERSCGPAAR